MNKFKLTSFLFLVLGVLVMFGAAYVVISYATGVIFVRFAYAAGISSPRTTSQSSSSAA